MSLPPLPPGWDAERVYAADEDDFDALSDSDRALISAWCSASGRIAEARLRATVDERNRAIDEERAAAGLPSVAEMERGIAREMGIEDYDPATQSELFDVAKALYNEGSEAWGFVVYKTWGYKDAEKERWNQFWKKWDELMDARLRAIGAVGDLKEGVAGMLQWQLMEHEVLDEKGVVDVRDSFAELVEEPEDRILSGLDMDLALMIDEAAVNSLLDGDEHPFVWGVDVNYDEDEETPGVGEDYPGHYKVAIDVLVPELWQMLEIVEHPGYLWPGSGKIYRGMLGEIQDEIAAEEDLATEDESTA